MKYQILTLALILFTLISCKKEGIGGKNTIIGTVIENVYDETTLVNSYPLPEKDVYIIYGDQGYYADKVKTNYDGSFRFEKLHKGNYEVFSYSECTNCLSGTEPVFEFVELVNRKEELFIDTIFVRKYE